MNEEETHPPGWLKIEKLIDGVWVNTGWAEDLKAFTRHAAAIGGKVRSTAADGKEKFTATEYVPIENINIDSEN